MKKTKASHCMIAARTQFLWSKNEKCQFPAFGTIRLSMRDPFRLAAVRYYVNCVCNVPVKASIERERHESRWFVIYDRRCRILSTWHINSSNCTSTRNVHYEGKCTNVWRKVYTYDTVFRYWTKIILTISVAAPCKQNRRREEKILRRNIKWRAIFPLRDNEHKKFSSNEDMDFML